MRTRHAQPLTDVRQVGELIDTFEPFDFFQIHRSWAVNLRRVREIRPAPEGGWEVKLDPPVNRVLPVSRRRISALWERFGEERHRYRSEDPGPCLRNRSLTAIIGIV